MGDDYLQGAVDPFGRVFAGDGSVHEGLYRDRWLGDSERAGRESVPDDFGADRALRGAQDSRTGDYPAPPASRSAWPGITRAGRDRLQRRPARSAVPPLPHHGRSTRWSTRAARPRSIPPTQTIRNDGYWKGFFPQGPRAECHVVGDLHGLPKQFFVKDGKYTGITSDTDDRIHARNSLEEIEIGHGSKGTLEPGNYILLRYLDPPWQGFYDIFKIINDDLLIGRVYLGEYPNGARVFTFPMSRRYGFDQMTVDDHAALYAAGAVAAPRTWKASGAWTRSPTPTTRAESRTCSSATSPTAASRRATS